MVQLYSGRRLVGKDVSESNFTIPGLVDVTSPAAGDRVARGMPRTISWDTHITDPVASVLIKYTLNGGKKWKKAGELNWNPGAFTWDVPYVKREKRKCRVRIFLRNAAGRVIAADSSDGYFTVTTGP
jgi:hypothetical protein